MSTLYEIVELPNGDIALQSMDESGEPIVSITFSKSSKLFMDDDKIDVAKAMIEAGLECVGAINHMEEDGGDDIQYDESVTLH